MHQPLRIVLYIVSVGLLTACQHQPHRPVAPLEGLLGDFKISGKMSFSDGQDGGSGRFQWQSQNDRVVASLKAPLGSNSWQIEELSWGAQLLTHQGEVLRAESAKHLISDQLGWEVPWDQLKSWLRLQPHDIIEAKTQRVDGQVVINEAGWRIEYSRFKPFDGEDLPTKVTASNQPYVIKVVIRDWIK